MNRPPNRVVPTLFTVLAVLGVVTAILAGSAFGVVAIGLGVAVVAAAIAFIASRQTRAVGASHGAAGHWWKFLATGGAMLVSFVVVTTRTGDLGSETQWVVAMVFLAAAVGLIATGIILGVAHLSRVRHDVA